MRLANILSVILVFFCTTQAESSDRGQMISNVADFVDNRWKMDEPGGAVVILERGKIVFEAYHGLGNIDLKIPITAKTIFPYASVTKRLTAATILSLVEAGMIDLDAPIGAYLDEIEGPLTRVTVRQLLTHSSGVPGNFEAEIGLEYSTSEHLQKITALPLSFEPGSKSSYSNNGYTILGALIERISGKAWHEAVIERVTKPLGLSSIQYLQNHIDARTKLAVGYWEEGVKYPQAPVKTASLLHANGAMAGTIRDLAFWVHGFHQGEVISRQSLEIAQEKRQFANGKSGWGMGLFSFKYRSEEIVVHDGGASGVNVYTMYLPSTDTVVVAATNVPIDARDLSIGIADRLLGAPYKTFHALPFELDAMQQIIGTYELPSGKSERLFLKDDALFFQLEKRRPMRVLSAGDGKYFIKRRQHWFHFEQDGSGTTSLHFYERGKDKPSIAVKE